MVEKRKRGRPRKDVQSSVSNQIKAKRVVQDMQDIYPINSPHVRDTPLNNKGMYYQHIHRKTPDGLGVDWHFYFNVSKNGQVYQSTLFKNIELCHKALKLFLEE